MQDKKSWLILVIQLIIKNYYIPSQMESWKTPLDRMYLSKLSQLHDYPDWWFWTNANQLDYVWMIKLLKNIYK